MDPTTEKGEDVTYARMCIEIHPRLILPHQMTVTDRKCELTIMRISYEWRPSRCFDCNTFKHLYYKCPKMIEEERKKKIEKETETEKKQKEEQEMLEKEKVENARQKNVTKESWKEDRVVRDLESNTENEEVTKKLEPKERINTEEVVERESVGVSKKGEVGKGNGKDKEETVESVETMQSPI
ncbi:beta-mannosyltransferase 2-like [Impatiens glandulifera]|uniref:beta-mannosyltransferase 2-like n=1 Tax=Impatiens glandulifera TaxID=253017 RepID=UPI001FB05A88|nr:beta-mannosyltransferase 2-like [Impatiens glandulifera]